MRLLHISDLHFGRFFQPKVAEALQRQSESLDYDAVAVSGDLTQRAKPGEFEDVSSFLARLEPIPMTVVPGNHDIPLYRVWERLFAPRRGFHRAFGEPLPSRVDVDDVRIVALDSTEPYRALSSGRVSRGHLERGLALFDEPGKPRWRVVVVHHNLVSPPGPNAHKPLPQARHILERMGKAKIDVVLSGHLHHAFVINTLDVYPGRERSRGMVLCNCGTTTSRRGREYEREKNSFNIIDFGSDGGLQIHHWVYFSANRAFRRVSTHTFHDGRSAS